MYSARILIIDDQPDVCQFLQERLGWMGHHADAVSTGAAGLARVTPEVDLVLLDVDLPDLHGFEVLREIRSFATPADIPVIVMTGADSREERLKAAALQANDFLPKPVDGTELGVRVGSALQLKAATDALKRQQQLLEAEVERRTAALQQARNDALTAERLKSAILRNMSHELFTPLHIISGYSELLRDELLEAGKSEWMPNIDQVLSACDQLTGHITNILELSDLEAGAIALQPRDIPVADILRTLSRKYLPSAAERRNTLAVECRPAALRVVTDREVMKALLGILVRNALEHTRDGEVVVRAEWRDEDCSAPFHLIVSDTGPGIPAEQLADIFSEFTQNDHSPTGQPRTMGLGLALARQYCRVLGGVLSVQSTAGVGTKFTARLPATAPSACGSTPDALSAKLPPVGQ